MSGHGIIGATINIRDDKDAILRARRAECHELRVLHHIRMRGRSVLNSINAVAVASERDGSVLGADYQNESSAQFQGRAFQPGNWSSTRNSSGLNESARSRHSYSADNPNSRSFNASSTGTSSSKESRPECTGFWCFLRDLALVYAILAVSFLLYKYFTSSTGTDIPSVSSEEAYDNVP